MPWLQTPTRKSRSLQSTPFAPLPLPFIARAPSFLFAPNRSLALAKASFTTSLLPITAPGDHQLHAKRREGICHGHRAGTVHPAVTRYSAIGWRPISPERAFVGIGSSQISRIDYQHFRMVSQSPTGRVPTPIFSLPMQTRHHTVSAVDRIKYPPTKLRQ